MKWKKQLGEGSGCIESEGGREGGRQGAGGSKLRLKGRIFIQPWQEYTGQNRQLNSTQLKSTQLNSTKLTQHTHANMVVIMTTSRPSSVVSHLFCVCVC